MPTAWDEFTVSELAAVLGESRGAAEDLLDLAHDLEVKLPGTKAAFRDGTLRASKVEIIARADAVLDPAEARAAEALVLGRAGRLTPGGLRAAIARAVMEVAPEKARKRREAAARDARVQRWAEDSGNAALMGRELPPAEVLAADQRITAWARELKKAGLDGDMDVLRARAYLDLLLDKDSRPSQNAAGADDAGRQDGSGPQDPPRAGRTGQGGPGQGGPGQGGPGQGGPGQGGPGGPGRPPGTGAMPAGFAARINLTVTLATLLGLADRPGEIPGIGPIDPWLARDLAASAAGHPKTTWCVTVTDQDGHAIGHGCARPEPQSHARRRDETRQTRPAGRTRSAPRDQRHPRARVLLHSLRPARPARRIRRLDAAHRSRRTARPARRPRPDHHRPMRPPLRGQGPRPRGQAPAPVPDPARHLHRPGLPTPRRHLRLRAQHPLRSRRAEPVCATADLSAAMTIGSSSTPGGK